MSWLLGGSGGQDLPTATPNLPDVQAQMGGQIQGDRSTKDVKNSVDNFNPSALERAAAAVAVLDKSSELQLEIEAEQVKLRKTAVIEAEKRKTIELDSALKKERADYQDRLARKRQEDQMAFQVCTIAYEADLRLKNETMLLEARLRGEAEMERVNRDIRLEKARVEAGEFRETVLKSITTAG
ncbi:unnamed protein product, partial [Protopolystoma xenopodis]